MVDPKRAGNSLGKVNDACGVLSRALTPKTRESNEEDFKTSMVVMLISHNFGSDVEQEFNDHSDLPHCSVTFPVRLGILTGSADVSEISAMAKHIEKFEYDEYRAMALEKLTKCMKESCCVEMNPMPPNSCTRSTTINKKTEIYST